jgi:predicted O-methyltransferase YrrM
VDEEYDWPPAATRAAKDTTASTSASIRAASAPPNGATHGFVANFMAKVRQDDVVLDVGANTGLFAIWLLERAHAHALATITTPEADASASVTAAAAQAPVDAPFRLVCIEPAPLTAAALRRNLNRFSHPNSTWVVEAAVVGPSTYPSSNSTSSSSSSSGSVGHGSANTMELCFLPHLPGNSHLAAYASEREGQEVWKR